MRGKQVMRVTRCGLSAAHAVQRAIITLGGMFTASDATGAAKQWTAQGAARPAETSHSGAILLAAKTSGSGHLLAPLLCYPQIVT